MESVSLKRPEPAIERKSDLKHILALLGSPRRLGNSEIMAKEIGRQLTIPHELKLLRLPDFNLAPCRGCYRCLAKGRCFIDDDFVVVADAILEADALLLIAPTYFLGPNASLKAFTDRGLALYPHLESLWGKPSVAVGIAGIPGKEGYTLLGLENFLTMLFADIRARRMVYGALPGEIFLNDHNRDIARTLANALCEPASESSAPCCPLCGGTTFRFIDHHRVRCMLCSNAGTLATAGGKTQIDIRKGDHDLFLTREDALAHREWLLSMKDRFKKQKDDLKRISNAYRTDGTWITAQRKANG
jgi:multimeric flavodoxin WrbA